MPSNCAPAETYKQINMEQNFILIGLDDSPSPFFPPEVQELIRNGRYFSGGVRHREIVASLLPDDATWMTINIPLDNVFAEYKAHFKADGHPIVVFASGDPLFSVLPTRSANGCLKPTCDSILPSTPCRHWHTGW